MDYPLNEMTVIGALLLSDNTQDIDYCFGRLTPKCFSVSDFKIIFANLKKQWAQNGVMDTTITASLNSDYIRVLKNCMDTAAIPSLLKQYTDLVFRDHRVNTLRKDTEKLIDGLTVGADMDVLLSELKHINDNQALFEQIGTASTSYTMLESIVKYYEEMAKPSELMKTGLASLDRKTGGFARKTFSTICGRSGSGKSDFMIYIACRLAAKGYKVLYLTMEMPVTQIINRIASRVANIDSKYLREKSLTKENAETLAKALDAISSLPIIFDEQQGVTMADVEQKYRQHKPDILIVDHIGLMQGDRKRQLWENTAEHSRELKRLAMNENIAVIGITQQTRDVENRKDKGARLSDIKGSDTIGNDVDMAFFIRADRGNDDQVLSGAGWIDSTLEIIKNRDGSTGKIEYHWQPQYHKYTEVTERY